MLKESVQINFKASMPDLSKRKRATHNIHKYPAKLIPHIPNYLIDRFSNSGDVILDGFCGSGTTLLESMLLRRNAVGIELNPVARLIAKVKTTPLNMVELKNVSQKCRSEVKKCSIIRIPEFKNRDFWFTKKSQTGLAKIKHVIENMEVDSDVRDFLLVCFSAIVRKTSNTELRDITPRLARQTSTVDPLNEFLHQLDFSVECMEEISDLKSKAHIIGDDVKKIDLRRRVDMVVTSPPYLAAIEYFRSMKLENFWLSDGDEEPYHKLARKAIHGEFMSGVKKELQYTAIRDIDNFIDAIYAKSVPYGLRTCKYFHDLQEVMGRFYRVLNPGCYCAIVVGNSQVLGQRAPLNEFLRKIGTESGFDFKMEILDTIKFHRLGTKRSNNTNRIYNEHIVIFKKP